VATDPRRASDEPAPSTEEQRPAAGPRVLRRSRDDRVLGGVCGGIGRYLGIDPVLVRVAFTVLVVGLGSGILVYLLACLVIPEERPGEQVGPAPPEGGLPGQVIVGLVLIGVGAVMLAGLVLPDVFDPRFVIPAMLILAGVLVVLQSARRR
jgi:phage shock protein C